MNVPSSIHKLKEKVTCSVCSNTYTNPKQLPCLHIFCLECLNDLARTSAHDGKIKCPFALCKIEVTVPETSTMETLPSCLHVKNLLGILANKECSTSEVICVNCDMTNKEASYCFHCDKVWCQDCLNAHNILKENKDHRVLALKDFDDEDVEDVLKRTVTSAPQSSVMVELRENTAATAVNTNIASKLDTAKESSNTIFNCIRLLEEKSRLLDYRSKTNKEEIRQTVKSLILTLQQKEQELVAEVENQTLKAQEQLNKHKGEFQDQLNKRKQFISQIETLVQRNALAEFASTNTIIGELFQGLQELQDLDMPSTSEWKIVTMFARNEEISECLQDSGIGHLSTKKTTTELNQCSVKWFQAATAGLETEIEVITRNSEGKQCYCPGDYITVQLISAQDRNTVIEMKIIDKNNGSYMISFIPSEAGQHLPTVQVNGETIGNFPPTLIKERSFTPVRFIANEVIEPQTFTQSLVDLVAQSSTWIKEESLNHPWGVTVNESNEIFVSDMDNNRIVVFNEKGKFIWSFGQNVVNKPTGICIDNKGRIFVANRGNNKILLFNSKGEYVTAVHNGDLLKEPRGMSLDGQGNLVVCDTRNNCLQFLSPNGSILKTIGEKGGLRFPFDCLCHDDKVFVSDRDAHLIKVYNHSNGRFLYEFGRYRNAVDVELNEPLGLAVDKLGNLLVCSGNLSNDHRVNVFSLDGRFVTAFGGSRGGELGQFGKPTSVTVLRDGSIVVCEFLNCRLQVFE